MPDTATGYSAAMAVIDTLRSLGAAFDAIEPLTIGVEEEIMLLDAETLQPAPRAAQLLGALGGDPHFKLELPATQLELVTPASRSVPELAASLRAARRDVRTAAGGIGLLAMSAAAHPFAAPTAQLNEDARCDALRAHFGAVVDVQQVCGLHVHVAVGGADTTIAVHDMLRAYLPELTALAAAAPFYGGADSGLASVRSRIAGLLPRQGLPPALGDMAGYARALQWLASGGVPPPARRWWWELRPHPTFGTLEVRVCDAQASASDSAALAAVVHALVAALRERCLAGERAAPTPPWQIEENSWSACRHGVGGTMADLQTGEPHPTRERLERMLDMVQPVGQSLGCAFELHEARLLLRAGGMPPAHRALAAERGVVGLVASLCERFCDRPGMTLSAPG